METGFLNFHDEEHFSTMPLSIYQQSAMLDDDSSLLDMIPDHLDSDGPWDAADMDRLGQHDKDDFNEMITNWQDQLGSMKSLQTCDNDDLYDSLADIKFDVSSFDSDVLRKRPLVGKDLSLARLACEDEDETQGLLEVQASATIKEEDDFRLDMDDECIDVETVTASEQIPVLEAGDVTTLLEQFEASETFNSGAKSSRKRATYLDSRLFAMATQPVGGAMSHQNIIDALPREVIERIKASGRKKGIPVIPAMPSKKLGRAGTRMQDAGVALTRNKLLKIVSSSPSTGESIQLDHDYCSAANSSSPSPEAITSRPFYHSDASDYCRTEERANKPAPTERIYSRLPDYYLVLNDITRRDSDSRKDSGLESGDLSDDSEENMCQNRSVVNCDKDATGGRIGDKIVTINGKTINLGSIMQNVNKALTSGNKDMPMVSVLKRNSSPEKAVAKRPDATEEKEAPKKRKLNLSEYRSRVLELDRHRSSCESSRASSPTAPTLEEAKQIFEQATQMLINAEGKIDRESFAEMKRTLERQATLRIPTHEEPREVTFPIERKHPTTKETCGNATPKDLETIVTRENVENVVPTTPRDVVNKINTSVEHNLVSPTSETLVTENDAPAKCNAVVTIISVDENISVVDMEISDESFVDDSDDKPAVLDKIDESTELDSTIESGECFSSHEPLEADSQDVEGSHVEVVKEVEAKSVNSRDEEKSSSEERSVQNDRGKRFDRSRRQFRSRRRESTSSSSSNSSHGKSVKQSSPPLSRSHSRSSSSSYSSRSRRSYSRAERSQDHKSRDNRRPIRSWLRSRSPIIRGPEYQLTEREKERQVEERRVIYVGRIGESMTKAELRSRFESFGPIVDISLHFREHADNYGFVTFAYKVDAYAAVEQGKKDPTLDQFDLSFGGRRAFCKSRYADLDVGHPDEDMYGYPPMLTARPRPVNNSVNFDDLLREALQKKKTGKV